MVFSRRVIDRNDAEGAKYTVDSVGVLKQKIEKIDKLLAGEIGILTASIKQVRDTRVGDTITHEGKPCSEALLI